MDPLTLGAISFGISTLGNMFGGFGAKEEAEKKNRALREQMNQNTALYDKRETELKDKDKSLSTDFLLSYATIREKDRADGLRGEYGRNKSEFASALSRLTSERAQLNSQLASQIAGTPSDSSIIGQSVSQGLGQGVSGYGSGIFADMLKSGSTTSTNYDY